MRPLTYLSSLALTSALSILFAGPAASGVPSPGTSTLPICLVQMCPYGDMVTTVVVRDAFSAPVAGAKVTIYLCECPDVQLCPAPSSEYVIEDGCKVAAFTDATGTVHFPIHGGGLCRGLVQIIADGVVLTPIDWVVSPDQDGNLEVDAADLAIFDTKFGTDPTADFICDGIVDASDRGLLMQHMGHTCDGVVPTLPHSWGRTKAIYR